MLRKKSLPGQFLAVSYVHDLLTFHGFKRTGTEEDPIYLAVFQDAATRMKYYLSIPVYVDKQRNHRARLGKARLKVGKTYVLGLDNIPFSILEAVNCKLNEIADYLNQRIKIMSI